MAPSLSHLVNLGLLARVNRQVYPKVLVFLRVRRSRVVVRLVVRVRKLLRAVLLKLLLNYNLAAHHKRFHNLNPVALHALLVCRLHLLHHYHRRLRVLPLSHKVLAVPVLALRPKVRAPQRLPASPSHQVFRRHIRSLAVQVSRYLLQLHKAVVVLVPGLRPKVPASLVLPVSPSHQVFHRRIRRLAAQVRSLHLLQPNQQQSLVLLA